MCTADPVSFSVFPSKDPPEGTASLDPHHKGKVVFDSLMKVNSDVIDTHQVTNREQCSAEDKLHKEVKHLSNFTAEALAKGIAEQHPTVRRAVSCARSGSVLSVGALDFLASHCDGAYSVVANAYLFSGSCAQPVGSA